MSIDQQLVEVVDFDGTFHDGFENMFAQLRLIRSGLHFNVVTVLGCQSSGKSTLLNAMFGTKFPEMDSSVGRGQTTKGIWCSKDIDSDTLVVDVEGTDSKERGEDRLTFEHRASLFSLAVADAVIVNMWYNDIGRYTASNYGLLKTVLAVMLELFHSAGDNGEPMAMPETDADKTMMIFIIRDFDPAVCTPLAKLERSLLSDVVQIWREIKKPLPLKNTEAEDFFKFIVVGLPNKLSNYHDFNKGVKKLKSDWLKKWRPENYSRKVPADGFPLYAKSVWQSIMSSQQLDIPSQKEMVALYRCDEIKNSAFNEIRSELMTLPSAQYGGGEAGGDQSSQILHDALETCLRHYHADAWRYDSAIYAKKRDELLELVFDCLQKSHDQKSNEIRQQVLKCQTENLRSRIRKDPFDPTVMSDGRSVTEHWSCLNTVLEEWRAEAVAAFEGKCDASRISQTITFDDGEAPPLELDHVFKSTIQEQLFKEQLAEVLKKVRDDEINSFKKYLAPSVEELRNELESLQVSIDHPTEYWNAATKCFGVRLNKLWKENEKFLSQLFSTAGNNPYDESTRESSGDLDYQTETTNSSKTPAAVRGGGAGGISSTSGGGISGGGMSGGGGGGGVTTSVSAKDDLAYMLYIELRNNISSRSDRIADQVYKRFKRFFEVDETGVPNYWASSSPDQIKKIFISAKEKSMPLHKEICRYQIDLLQFVTDSEDLVRQRLTETAGLDYGKSEDLLLSPARELDSSATAEKYMLKSCQEAQFIQATGGRVTKASWWMWILILCLGWNEFLFVLKSPIFSISAATLICLLGAAWYTGSLFMLVKSGRLMTSAILSIILPILQELPATLQQQPPLADSQQHLPTEN